MKIPLLRGRDFTDSDTIDAPEVMILSRATARAFWGDEDPIGRTVRRVADSKDFTVSGIVGDVRSTTLNNESPALYYSAGGRVWPLMDIVVRPAGDPAAVIAAIRRQRALRKPTSRRERRTRYSLPALRDGLRDLRAASLSGLGERLRINVHVVLHLGHRNGEALSRR